MVTGTLKTLSATAILEIQWKQGIATISSHCSLRTVSDTEDYSHSVVTDVVRNG